jgi:L-erythrulose 1-phosphate isomerase
MERIMTTKKWIGTGWKMNHLMDDAMRYADKLIEFYKEERPTSNIFICVPFTVLHSVASKLAGIPILVSSQNVHWLDKGAVTGEISPLMVKDAGAGMVEIGHSERRSMFAETDEIVNLKVRAALRNGLRAIICVGETADDKEKQLTAEKLTRQVKAALKDVAAPQAEKILIAYEPVWAIGESGSPATPEYADAVHEQIKNILRDLFWQTAADQIPVLYGGSVNQNNAIELISRPNIDGLFIGRAAWQAEGFISTIRMVEDHCAA